MHSRSLIAALLALGAWGETSSTPSLTQAVDAADNPNHRHGPWTWFEPAGMACGDGSPTGFAINVSGRSKRVVAYLEGGGACNSAASCYGSEPTADFMGGYTEADFAVWAASTMAKTNLFDRNDPQNPFRNDSIVYIPYCTGDLHAGNNVASYGAHHVGYKNIDQVISTLGGHLVQRSPIDLILMGASAGGCGALYNLHHVQQAFPAANITLIDDSCPLLPAPYVVQVLNGPGDPWGLRNTVPPGCQGCAERLNNLYAYYARTMPQTRMSHIEGLLDEVISSYYDVPGTELQIALLALQGSVGTNKNFKFFLTPTDQHEYLTGNGVPSLGATWVRNTSLAQFLQEQISGDPTWASVSP